MYHQKLSERIRGHAKVASQVVVAAIFAIGTATGFAVGLATHSAGWGLLASFACGIFFFLLGTLIAVGAAGYEGLLGLLHLATQRRTRPHSDQHVP